MKPMSRFLPPRQAVIFAYTRRMLDETATNANSFAMRVAELYHQQVAPDVRQVKLRLGDGDELLRAMRDNGQLVRRYMDGTVKVMPADLEDAWVMALAEPYRSDCERDLARRRGQLCFRADDGAACAVANVGRLSVEFGELLGALAPALTDGAINEKDLAHCVEILNKSDDMMSALISLRRTVMAAIPTRTARHA